MELQEHVFIEWKIIRFAASTIKSKIPLSVMNYNDNVNDEVSLISKSMSIHPQHMKISFIVIKII